MNNKKKRGIGGIAWLIGIFIAMRVSLLNFTISWHKFVTASKRERQSCNSHAIEIPLIKFDEKKIEFVKNKKKIKNSKRVLFSFHASLSLVGGGDDDR
jgi:hypothetical protein